MWILTSYLRWKFGTLKPSAVTGLRGNGRRRLGPPPPWPHCTLHPARCCSASGDDGAQHGATGRTGDAWQLRNVGNSLNKVETRKTYRIVIIEGEITYQTSLSCKCYLIQTTDPMHFIFAESTSKDLGHLGQWLPQADQVCADLSRFEPAAVRNRFLVIFGVLLLQCVYGKIGGREYY